VLTQEAFDRLLARFDADPERAGELYEAARRKLVKFLEWRGSDSPEEHADETLNRAARKIAEGETVRDLNSYLLGVARLVLLEVFKAREHERAALEQLPQPAPPAEDSADETRRACLEQCLDSLPAESRELIVAYYQEERGAKIEWRRRLADSLGVAPNALRIRAHRVRAKLEECVHECVARRKGTGV
jgi:RNA polymerase sigma factor (sigma-70 family)